MSQSTAKLASKGAPPSPLLDWRGYAFARIPGVHALIPESPTPAQSSGHELAGPQVQTCLCCNQPVPLARQECLLRVH